MGEQIAVCECGHEELSHEVTGRCCEFSYADLLFCDCEEFIEESTHYKDDELVSSNGGKRQRLNLRFDKLPGGFTSLSWIARVAEYGNIKKQLNGEYENWQKCDPCSEQAPLNHGIGHALEACELPFGSLDRIWALSKAAWNLLAQIWFEVEDMKDGRKESADGVIDEWFEKKCGPTTYKREGLK